MADPAAHAEALRGRRVIVAVTGGIAAYKTAALVSRLAQSGSEVTVLMTEAATRFVGPLTFESLSGRAVLSSIWQQVDRHDSQHVAVARGAELMVIAPASANTIAKLAAGICDNVVTTVAAALRRETPVLVAPAMNEQMWAHAITQRNMTTLREVAGYHVGGPGHGWQACRTEGAGRMSEPEAIFEAACELLGAPDAR